MDGMIKRTSVLQGFEVIVVRYPTLSYSVLKNVGLEAAFCAYIVVTTVLTATGSGVVRLDLDLCLILVLVNSLLAPVACASLWTITRARWRGNSTGLRQRLIKAGIVVAWLGLFGSLYVQLGQPLNTLYLSQSHESGVVREFLKLVSGLTDSEYRQFAK